MPRAVRGKKKEITPHERAVRTYVFFLCTLMLVLMVFGSIYPSFLRQHQLGGRSGGATADFLRSLGASIQTFWYVGLAPALAGTILWLSSMDRQAVHRILYVCNSLMGFAMIGGSVALFSAFPP